MSTIDRTGIATLMLAALLAATPIFSIAGGGEPSKKSGASKVEPIAGTKLSRVTLTQKAAQRLDIKTELMATEAGVLAAPYASVVYDVVGATWVYTSPAPLSYVRHLVVIDSIKGTRAMLKEGPPAGTPVVVVGAAELYGTESGIGH